MSLISFPNNWLVNAGPAGQKLVEPPSSPLFGAGTQTKKNERLIKMLNNLAGKDIYEIEDYCINLLKMISCIVEAGGDIVSAKNKLDIVPGLETSDIRNQLLILFTNRNTGCTAQNINRTAAKYVEVLRQTLQTIDGGGFTRYLTVPEQKNLNILREESDKWYRGSYIKHVKVSIKDHKLNIQLGRQNGTMGSVHKLELDIPIALVDQIITVNSSKMIQINDDLLYANYFEHNTVNNEISVKRCVLDSVLKEIKKLDLGGENDGYCKEIVIKCLIKHVTLIFEKESNPKIVTLVKFYKDNYKEILPTEGLILEILIAYFIVNNDKSQVKPSVFNKQIKMVNDFLDNGIINHGAHLKLYWDIISCRVNLSISTQVLENYYDAIDFLCARISEIKSINPNHKYDEQLKECYLSVVKKNVLILFESLIGKNGSTNNVSIGDNGNSIELVKHLLNKLGKDVIDDAVLINVYNEKSFEFYHGVILEYLERYTPIHGGQEIFNFNPDDEVHIEIQDPRSEKDKIIYNLISC